MEIDKWVSSVCLWGALQRIATNGIFQSVNGVWGIFTFLLHSQRPDRVAWGRRFCGGCTAGRIRSLSVRRSALSLVQPLAPVLLYFPKRRHWSQSEPSTIGCTGHPRDLLSVGGPFHPPLTILPLSCLACFWPPSLFTHARTLAHCHRQVPPDGSLTRLFRQDLTLPSPTSPVWCFSLVILTHPQGHKGKV